MIEAKQTQRYTLRAMAKNYAGGHSWDHLDGEVCTKAADEILFLENERDKLRSELSRLKAGQGEAYAWFWSHGADQGVLTQRQDYEQHLIDYPGMMFTPVYLAPPTPDAAQVMVPRELLERVVKADASRGANALQLVDGWKAMDELRAILAQHEGVKP